MKLELPRGMRDLEQGDLEALNYVREKFLETATLFNFKLMEPSPLEMLATLEAKSGTSISNEIYNFTDKGGRSVALRFDLTIGLTRFVASRRDLKMPAKIATFAGVWRYDEPQAGRYRFFHQWDIEVYGPFSQESDAEVIQFISIFFKKLDLDVVIEVNSREVIEEYVRKILQVSDDSTIMEMFRAVDKVSKKGIKSVLEEYKGKLDSAKLEELVNLSTVKGSVEWVISKIPYDKLESWTKLKGLMDSLSVRKVDNVKLNLGIVRGLDYYSGIVFEVFSASEGGGALVGGGRYDKLTSAFGRPDIGATGAAGGIERIILALQKKGLASYKPKPLVYVASTAENLQDHVIEITASLRDEGIASDYDMLARALRKQLDDASSKGAVAVVIVGQEISDNNSVTVRKMKSGEEIGCTLNDLPKILQTMVENN